MADQSKGSGSGQSGPPGDIAQRVAAVAAKMVASNPNIEAFKRIIVSNKGVQDALAAATSTEDFINKGVQLAEQNGVPFTAAEAQDHLAKLQETHPAFVALSSEPGGGGGGGGSTGGGGSSGCSSQNTVTNPAYSIQCGLRTQKCLCTL
jgi:hypothetical protein